MVGRRQHSVNEKLGGEGNDMADDLARMRQGRMDRAGAADTRRGMWWGRDLGICLAFFGGFLCAPLLFFHFVYPFFR
jgi:hypothetical protein